MSATQLGRLLVAEGRLHREELAKALEMQSLAGGRLGSNLLELGFVDEEALAAALSRQRGTQIVSGRELRDIPPEILKLVPEKLARRYRIVPFKLRGRNLLIASTDPGDALVEDEIGLLTSCLARTLIALEVRIHEALERYYRMSSPPRLAALSQRLANANTVRRAPTSEPNIGPTTLPVREHSIPVKSLVADADISLPASDPTAGTKASSPVEHHVAHTTAPAAGQFIELDAEDLALLYGDRSKAAEALSSFSQLSDASLGPFEGDGATANAEERLAAAAVALQASDIRDEIGDALLAFCRPYFRRRLLLILRADRILGWRGEGDGWKDEEIRKIEIPTDHPSVFFGLSQGAGFWLGPLPAMPGNRRLIEGLGGDPPTSCLALPIALRGRVVSFLYADNESDGVTGAPIAELRRLVAKAGLALEVYLLKNKIRTL